MTNTILVYRFENEAGFGPFNTGHTWKFFSASCERGKGVDPQNMPAPTDLSERGSALAEKVKKTGGNLGAYMFGFASLDQVDQSFGCIKGRLAMHRRGCYLFVYRAAAKDVVLGNHQLIFLKASAERVKVLNPSYTVNPKLTAKFGSQMEMS